MAESYGKTGPHREIRIDAEFKQQFVKTKTTFGMNLTTFMVSAAQEPAVRAERRTRTMVLSDRDRDRFLEAFDGPARPVPEAIEKARALHAQLIADE